MTTNCIVLIATKNAQILHAVRSKNSALEVMLVNEGIPDIPTNKQLYCFIEWVLPHCSGLDICSSLRMFNATKSAHITMVMETRDIEAQRKAIRAGADSYIMGPMTEDLIIDRISKRISMPVNANPPNMISHGNFTVDFSAYRVRYGDHIVSLPPSEFRILTHFIENPDKLITRRSLMETLGKNSDAIDERIVNVWIRRLRRTLKTHQVPDPLRTVRSKGYVMDTR
jgi:two-component system, OmpR family, phosphate regulon response regulator PhoB